MSKQSTALRLADELEMNCHAGTQQCAAAELRRLHALNGELLEALKECLNCEFAVTDKAAISKARAVIAKAEGQA
jgi:hypothetical protein